MATHKLLDGTTLEYNPTPEVADYLARVQLAVADPSVGVSDVIELIYSEDNPLLVKGIIPGRGTVTPEVLNDPTYRVFTNLLDAKRVQVGTLRADIAHAPPEPLTVAQAAERLGVSPGAVRQAIANNRLPATKVGRIYSIRPADLASFKPSRRGPTPREPRSPVLDVVSGQDHAHAFRVWHDGVLDGEHTPTGGTGSLRDWKCLLVQHIDKATGRERACLLGPGHEERRIGGGPFEVRGRVVIFLSQEGPGSARGIFSQNLAFRGRTDAPC